MNKKPSLMGVIASQLIAFLVCVGAPVALTTMAPVTWIKFQRQGGQVNVHADVCLLFVIPYRRLDVAGVTSVGDRTVAGQSYTKRRNGVTEHHNEEDKGYLAIRGANPDDEEEVLVSPHNLKDVIAQAESFLKDSNARELKLFVAANWKFGVIGGGVMSLFTVLWVVGVLGWIVTSIGRLPGMGRRGKGP